MSTSAARPPAWLAGAGATLVLFAILVLLRLHGYYPPFANPLHATLELTPGTAGRADPVIVAGRTGSGDFLSVRFEDERTLRFTYDSWGIPGIPSEPVRYDGSPLRLELRLPALDQILGGDVPHSDRVVVRCNGITVLDTSAHAFLREPDELFFATNPLGGTACGPRLDGALRLASGSELRGPVSATFSRPERLAALLQRRPGQVVALLLLSVGTVFAVCRWHSRFAPAARELAGAIRRHRWFAATALASSVPFAWMVTIGSFRLDAAEVFGSFYDYQAASFLAGRLDVPEPAIGGEAFEARGKLYGYFGPTPALLRLPFTLTGFAFGKLSRAFMLLYFAATLLAAYRILCDAVRWRARGSDANDAALPSRFATLVLTTSTGLGSTVFFLGSRGLIFHEAILAGITFALWSAWCSLRHLQAPAGRWWLGALICGILSVHCRPPTGLFALTLLGVVALIAAWRGGRAAVPRQALIGALCAAGFLSLNGLAWLKFRTFDAAPLRLSRPYTDPGRLQHIGGKSFHLVNLPYNTDAYLLRPNLRFERGFPWIYLGATTPPRSFPQARIDLPDFTLGPPYAMTSLFLLATLGAVVSAATCPPLRAGLAALWLAVLPMTLALFAAVATAQRYTGDFCPFLIAGGALGLAGVEALRSRLRAGLRVMVAATTIWSVAVTAALTLHYQRETLWGVPPEARDRYQAFRREVDAWLR